MTDKILAIHTEKRNTCHWSDRPKTSKALPVSQNKLFLSIYFWTDLCFRHLGIKFKLRRTCFTIQNANPSKSKQMASKNLFFTKMGAVSSFGTIGKSKS